MTNINKIKVVVLGSPQVGKSGMCIAVALLILLKILSFLLLLF